MRDAWSVLSVCLIGCFRSATPPPAPVAATPPLPPPHRSPDHERTINVDVMAENTALGAVITMNHHRGATWVCRVTNIGSDPITLDLSRSTFRSSRGTRLGPLRGPDSDYVVFPDGATRTFLVTPRPLRRLRNDARMWPVMVDGVFELSLTSPRGELRWEGRVFEHQPQRYDITGAEVRELEESLASRTRLPAHRAGSVGRREFVR